VSLADAATLRSELERLLTEHFGRELGIAALEQRPNPYRSSFAVQEVDVALDDGRKLALLLKDLSWDSLEEEVRTAKPRFVHDPLREIEVYRRVLPDGELGTATCYGTIADEEHGTYWLLLERVRGERLTFIGEFATWQVVARWLARLHERLAPLAPALPEAVAARLLRYDGDLYRGWLTLAEAAAQRSGVDEPLMQRLRTLRGDYGAVVDRLAALPATIIHGEFYPENVLVEQGDGEHRVCPVDWEMAGVGPGVVDVAGLTAGAWTIEQKESLALAYHGALEGERPPREEFLADLALCRIHLALQWAAASERAAGGREQVERWLTEALDTADALGL
jgi:aminoglycoside phosphotransferase (APT) family kinase protein